MEVTHVPLETPGTGELLRTPPALVVACACVCRQVAPKVIGGQAALATDLAPEGVLAPVRGLVTTKDVESRKAPTTLETRVCSGWWEDRV